MQYVNLDIDGVFSCESRKIYSFLLLKAGGHKRDSSVEL